MSAVKRVLKNSKILVHAHEYLRRRAFARLLNESPEAASRAFYKQVTGKTLNLDNPTSFNEKLQWLKLRWQNPLVARCADKYEMHAYAKERGCAEVLNEVYGVYNDAREIDWETLPNKFAIKTTNACATNIICDDKSALNTAEATRKLRRWLKIDYSTVAAEIHYKQIKPRIIAEKYIETAAGLLPNDYKIYCFNGKARLILVATDRGTDLKLNFLSLDWEKLDIGSSAYNKGEVPARPICLAQMIENAERLAEPFPFVRVDFYDFDGRALLGEMTFTPAGCAATYYSEAGALKLGNMLQLPAPLSAA